MLGFLCIWLYLVLFVLSFLAIVVFLLLMVRFGDWLIKKKFWLVTKSDP